MLNWLGPVHRLLDGAGEDANRAVEVAREAESAAGELSRKPSDGDEPGTGRGLAGDEACLCPDIGKRWLCMSFETLIWDRRRIRSLRGIVDNPHSLGLESFFDWDGYCSR